MYGCLEKGENGWTFRKGKKWVGVLEKGTWEALSKGECRDYQYHSLFPFPK
ncbi:MAG: hypothetical protein JETT_3554 [Candidatus Jettenia ecosi]|uniref:Uncharacterized protein n=1 Tax=Candidatus Jettenia ecosi TaxID=2494326 RepID=A0A533Q6H6_9BACT|nr:MAG: hypothetical protein JETT_3554 [Candidatus Jettenia ecosi]